MEPPRSSDAGVPTEPVPRIDGPHPRGPDSAAGERPSTAADHPSGPRLRAWTTGPSRARRRVVLLVVAVLVVAGAVVGIVDPFAKPAAPVASKSSSTYTVSRQDLSSQTEVTATLGYTGSYTVTLASGTAPQSIVQDEAAVTTAEGKVKSAEAGTTTTAEASVTSAEQGLAQAKATLKTAETSVQSAEGTLATAKATLAAGQAKEANDCAGSGSTGTTCASDGQQVGTDDQAVAQDDQTVTQDKQVVAQDEQKVTQAVSSLSQAKARASQAASTAQDNVTAAEQTLSDAQAALAAAQEEEGIQGGAFSKLPAVGQVVSEGGTLYDLGATPVVLLYGTTPATRNLSQGESGPDVGELNHDLSALGYTAPTGDTFTGQTASAVDAFQSHIGVAETGNLALGQVVFLPTAARVTKVTGVLGASAQPGSTVLTASSTTKEVSIALDADLQSDVKVGDPVTITLPDLRTTPGVVSYVGTVATTPASTGNTHTGSSTPSITVDVTPSDPSAIGDLDQAPVTVSITNASVHNVLVVPVDALLALASGGYALEVVPAHGAHYLIPVTTGLFDDQEGLVQVTGSQVQVGMRVVVPST